MAESPVIATSRLKIVPFGATFLTLRYVGWLNDPEVMQYSEQRRRQHTLQSCETYWRSFADTPNYFWAIQTKTKPAQHIGNMNAYVNREDLVADIGILIGEKQVWGCGYGLEAWRAVCQYLLQTARIRKITAGTIEPNVAMLRLMQKAGMLADGRRVRQTLWSEREVDVIHMALFAAPPPTD